jgi:hypothetical protein
MRTPVRALALGALSLSILLSACGGREEQTTTEATETPTSGGQAIPIASLAELKSFRYSITMHIEIPGLEDELFPGFAALLSDVEIRGASAAPDKSEMQMTLGESGQVMGAVVIGERTWFSSGEEWTETLNGAPDVSLLSPEKVSGSVIDEEAFAGAEPTKEKMNGVDALHYTANQSGLGSLRELLGVAEPENDVPVETRMDLWLTEDGGYPVRMAIDAGGTDAAGGEVSVQLEMNVTDLNDPGIEIEPPHS